MFFNIVHEKSGRPDRLCDVMMTCGHDLGRSYEFPPTRPRRVACRAHSYVSSSTDEKKNRERTLAVVNRYSERPALPMATADHGGVLGQFFMSQRCLDGAVMVVTSPVHSPESRFCRVPTWVTDG